MPARCAHKRHGQQGSPQGSMPQARPTNRARRRCVGKPLANRPQYEGPRKAKNLRRSLAAITAMRNSDTQPLVDLLEAILPKGRSVAGYSTNEDAAPMRNAHMYSNAVRAVVHAALSRTDIQHVELVSKTDMESSSTWNSAYHKGALLGLGGVATWVSTNGEGRVTTHSTENVRHNSDFRLEFGKAANRPTAKARKQLRTWGFRPCVVSPFSAFGQRHEVTEGAATPITEQLQTVDRTERRNEPHSSS